MNLLRVPLSDELGSIYRYRPRPCSACLGSTLDHRSSRILRSCPVRRSPLAFDGIICRLSTCRHSLHISPLFVLLFLLRFLVLYTSHFLLYLASRHFGPADNYFFAHSLIISTSISFPFSRFSHNRKCLSFARIDNFLFLLYGLLFRLPPCFVFIR